MPFIASVSVRNGKYTDVRIIGQGAYGQVYYARDSLGREVAVKEVLPSNAEFQNFRAKFQKEAQIQAAFRHPNIIQLDCCVLVDTIWPGGSTCLNTSTPRS